MGPALQGPLQYCGRTGASAPTQSKEMRTSTDGRGRTPPLRKRCKECDAVRNPPGTASPCQPPLGKGVIGTGVRIATGALRPRNDTSQEVRGSGGAHGPRPTRAFARIAGGQGRPPLRCCVTKKSVGEGLCPSHGRGNRRSAASGGCSEPVSRKRPDWRARQWPGIGWHDGGQENPAPTKALQGVRLL